MGFSLRKGRIKEEYALKEYHRIYSVVAYVYSEAVVSTTLLYLRKGDVP